MWGCGIPLWLDRLVRLSESGRKCVTIVLSCNNNVWKDRESGDRHVNPTEDLDEGEEEELSNDGDEANGERKSDGGILPVDDGVRVFVGVGVAVVWDDRKKGGDRSGIPLFALCVLGLLRC